MSGVKREWTIENIGVVREGNSDGLDSV